MGNGPVNYPAIARALFHTAFDKSRRVDLALMNEMIAVSDEYGAVTVTNESVSLANNTSYNGSGSVTVNLNTSKLANAAVVAGDPSVTYGVNVIGAVRFKTAGNGTSAPYCGISTPGNWQLPVVVPRTQVDLSAAGQLTSTAKNPITVSAPGGAVEGYIDANGQVQDKPGVAGATYAVDHNNGVLVFKSGVAGAASAITTAVTITYGYVTNLDNFQVNNITSLLATGETPAMYYNRLFQQFDITAAKMGSAPRFMPPNLALMSLNASVWITMATIFYNFNNPKGTNLFPSSSYFFERTQINGARFNAPWRVGDTRILLNRIGTTKYGIDEPFQVKGPFPAYDTNGKIIDKDIYYGAENSVICTPQVQDQSGNVLNPVARSIYLR
jgi:hypothetical protein